MDSAPVVGLDVPAPVQHPEMVRTVTPEDVTLSADTAPDAEGTEAMKISAEENKPAITRLKRARGQLDAVIAALENGGECDDAVMQLSAAAKAIDRAGYLIVATGMRKCFEAGGEDFDQKKLEKLFLSLA